MKNIQLLNKIAKCGTDIFDKDLYNVADTVENPDAIMVRSAVMHDMEFGDNLKAIARAGAGVNNIPLDRAAEEGIVVFNTPGANANAVKELVIGALMLSSRKVAAAYDWCKTLKGEGDAVGKLVEKGKSQFAGPEIMGKTLGIIGLGAIGVKVANAAHALGMNVIAYDPFVTDKALFENDGVVAVGSVEELYAASDFLSLHIPATAETKGSIGYDLAMSMPKGATIVNTARKEVINEEGLMKAMEEREDLKYVTDIAPDAKDVYAEKFGKRYFGTPKKQGAETAEANVNAGLAAANQIVDFFTTGNKKFQVNK